jgi:hypothetical protein
MQAARRAESDREAHAFEVDEPGLEARGSALQQHVRALQVAVVDARAVQRDREVRECIENFLGSGGPCFERERRGRGGLQVLEHDPGRDGHAEHTPLAERKRERGSDATREKPVSRAPGPKARRSAPHIGQRARDAAKGRLLHDDSLARDFECRHR